MEITQRRFLVSYHSHCHECERVSLAFICGDKKVELIAVLDINIQINAFTCVDGISPEFPPKIFLLSIYE